MILELDEQVKQQINDYGRGMAAADLAPKPDCVWRTMPLGRDANGKDIFAYDPQCLPIDGVDSLPMAKNKFCQYCGGAVKEST